MNQEKIGKFIAECRKRKKLTQAQLAEKLGVSDKTISNWENARCLPDLSLFSPLCKTLDISINDLLSGEQVDSKDYNEKLEENIVNTIDYLDKKRLNQKKYLSIFLIIIGFLLFIISFIFLEKGLVQDYTSVIGTMLLIWGINQLASRYSYFKRIIVLIIITLCIISLLLVFYQ